MNAFHKKLHLLLLCLLASLTACTPATDSSLPEKISESIEPVSESEQAPITEFTATPEIAVSEVEIDIPAGIGLEFWHPWSGSQAEVFENLVEEFNQSNLWGIRVTSQNHGDELVMMADIDQAALENSLPDIVAAPSQYLRLWDRQNLPIMDLNSYIQSAKVGLDQEVLNGFLPVFWKSDVDENGKRLGVPAYRNGYFLFYNQSWARDLGFEDYPRTIADFAGQACAAGIANLSDDLAENNGTGGWIYDIHSISGYSWLKAFSGDAIIGENGYPDFPQESNQNALKFLFDWYAEDCAWTGRQSEPYEYFARRYALFYSGSTEDIFPQEHTNADNASNDEWLMIPYPTDEQRPVVIVDGASFALMGEDEDKNLAAWLFLHFMLESENQVRIVEETGALPISNTVINLLDDFRQAHPAWDQALQSLAYAQNIPLSPEWITLEPVFSDIAWQLRFTQTKENILEILRQADEIVQEIITE